MNNNKILKLFNSKKDTDGYTLTELIIGASISVVVIGAAGMGLMNMLQGNKASTAEGDRITEVNRSLEFISDEVRRAERIETNPTADLPSGFDASGKEVVLALDLPDLGQLNPDDKIIYYVRPAPNNTWLGPNVIYRYGPPLDTAGGSYTNNNWVEQALVDRISDRTLTPSCDDNETAISAEGFAACVDNGQKVARIYVNGQFSDYGGDNYQANLQVYARATEANLDGKDSTITFSPITASGSSRVKIIDSQMGCNSSGDECEIATQFYQEDGTTTIGSSLTDDDGETDVNIGTNAPFVVKVSPSVPSGMTSPYPSYFDDDGNLNTSEPGLQNNSKPISVKVDLSKDYLTENPLTILGTDFTLDQVQLLGDKSPLPDNEAWNPENNQLFDTLTEILNTNDFLDSDGDLQLEANQYLLVVEVGQTDTNHPGFDLQDQIILITVD